MEKITSKNNTIIKDTKKLFTSSKARAEQKRFVLEGARLCFDVLNSVYEADSVFYTESIMKKYPDKLDALIKACDSAYLIGDDIAQKLTDTKTAQGIFLTVKMRDCENETGDKVIALDNVQDPSNVGAIIRSAEALGIDSVVVYDGCDIYNPKAIRASMGSVLRMNVIKTDDLSGLIGGFSNDGYSVYATVPDSSAVKITDVDFSGKSVCVIGNEANGVEQKIKSACDGLVTIPMLGRAESLNASVAASIIMWEMLR